ncbi:MAG: eukaryotic-like serine/threonine-protein kinase [bacterium]
MSLDDYDVIRELGRGGMAVVHLARQREMQRLVALKELGGFQARDPATVERFLRESRLAGSLNHPNIVTVYEYFEDGGTPYIAMELVEGGSLRPLIGELSLPRVARVLEDLLAAVGHAGKAGIVHRDIKPENTLITKDGRIKVADFGIAKGAAASGQQGLTSEGMTVGTPEYMSPEQALGKGVAPPSDLYSIGCMTYEMLTGRLPFAGDTQGALLVRQVSEAIPDVRDVDPLIPESVAQWVATMTEKDPDDRFPDASAAWEAFEEAVLEFIGPLWRRDATIEPASEIDLSSLPEQTAKPLTSKGKPSSTPLVTGYQTYQAPAALHELLEGDPDAAPAVVTPPPRPAATPPRRKTAAPVAVPTVSGAPAVAAKPAAKDEAEEKPSRPVPVGMIVAAGIVVAIVAFVVGISGGKSTPVATAKGDGFTLKAPDGWKPATAVAIPGLSASTAALAPPGAAPGEGIAGARLPTSRYASLASRGTVSHVKLGAGEAVRIASTGSSLFVLPTDAGLVVVGCSPAPAVRAACPAAAGSVELAGSKALAPGPTDDGARALGGALKRLSDAVRNPTEDLRSAGSSSSQATAASDLARAFDTAAREVRGTALGALATSARDELASALGAVASGWTRYSKAADSRSSSAIRSASKAVDRARGRVTRARSALAAAGYPRGGG